MNQRVCSQLEAGRQHRFEFFLVGGEFADAFGEFFDGHRVAVVLPVKFGFGERRGFFGCTAFGFEFARQRGVARLQFGEKRRGDGEAVAAGQFGDFADVAEARAHDDGRVAVFFVVAVDGGYGFDAGVFGRGVVCVAVRFVPVEDAADKGRDEVHARFCTGARLGLREEQGEVAVDAFFFEGFGGADALPGGRDFDEDAFAAHACRLVEGDDFARFGDGGSAE